MDPSSFQGPYYMHPASYHWWCAAVAHSLLSHFRLASLFCRGFFENALTLPLSTYGLPMLLMFPTHPVTDQSLGNLYRYTECGLRSYENYYVCTSTASTICYFSPPKGHIPTFSTSQDGANRLSWNTGN
jgi:hypothetical protein